MQHNAGSYRNEVSSINNIPQRYENGNTKFSLKENVEEAKNIKRDIIIVDNTEDIGYGSANGFYKNDKIVLSLDNQAGMMSVYLGHELFHDIKVNSPELANQLQDFIIERLQQDKSYDLKMRVAEICEQYEFEGENAREQALEEISANACFGVLSQQTNVEALAKENKTLLTKVRDFFKNFIEEIKKALTSIAKANAEYRSLHNDVETYEKILKMFNEALNANKENGTTQKNTTDKGDVKYMLSKDTEGNTFVDVTEDIFDVNNGESVAQVIQKVISKKYNNLISVNGQNIQINKTTNDEFRHSNSAVHFIKDSSQAYTDKLKTIANADEILFAARNWIGEKLKHERKDDIVEFARANVMYRVRENGYVADVLVGLRENGAAVLYDLVNIYGKEITEASVTMASDKIDSQRRQNTSVNDVLLQNSSNVKSLKDSEKFSLKENVEEAKDLIAVHNLSEEKLLKSFNLGGLPMPSIAVMKAIEAIEELKNNSNTPQLKQQLSDDVFGLAKDSRLAESYNEKARRGQTFEADLSKYDTKQHAYICKLMLIQ